MIGGAQSFERFKQALRQDSDLAQLVPFIDMYLVRFPDRNQAVVLFDALAQRWAEARGYVLQEAQ